MRKTEWPSWLFFLNPYSRWNVGRSAKRNGQATPPLPAWDDESQPEFLRGLKDQADLELQLLSAEWDIADRTLKSKWISTLDNYSRCKKEEIEAKESHQQACQQYVELHDKEPPPLERLSSIGYWILAGTLMICEFPMNSVVFKLLGENLALTYIATFAIILCLVVCAHDLGRRLKHGKCSTWQERLLTGAALVIPLCALAVVAPIRAYYMKENVPAAEAFSDEFLWIAFFTLNILILGTAVLAAYHSTPDLGLVEVVRTRHKLRQAERAKEKAKGAVVGAKIKRANVHEEHFTRAGALRERFQQLVRHYRDENLYYRTDREGKATPKPASFSDRLRNVLEVTIPPTLAVQVQSQSVTEEGDQSHSFQKAELDWDCKEFSDCLKDFETSSTDEAHAQDRVQEGASSTLEGNEGAQVQRTD